MGIAPTANQDFFYAVLISLFHRLESFHRAWSTQLFYLPLRQWLLGPVQKPRASVVNRARSSSRAVFLPHLHMRILESSQSDWNVFVNMEAIFYKLVVC